MSNDSTHDLSQIEKKTWMVGMAWNARILYNNILLPNNENKTYFLKEPSSTKSAELWTDTCTDVVRLEAML